VEEEVLYKPQRQPRQHRQPDLHTAPGLKLATVRDLHLSIIVSNINEQVTPLP